MPLPQKTPEVKSKLSPQQKKVVTILTYIGIALLLLIPTYIAIASYLVGKNAPEESTDTYYTSMELIGPGGNTVTLYPATHETSASEEAKIFDCFRSMLENDIYATGVPEEHTGRYQVVFQTNMGVERYTFHFSTEKSSAYITDANQANWLTEDAAVEYFLNSHYAYELYEQSAPPVLTTAATDVIVPSLLTWSYQTKDGTFADRVALETTEELRTYPIANDIAFYFTRQPSTCHLTIRQNGNVIIEQDSVDGISLAQLTQGTILDFEIEAIYGQSSANKYYGRAVYRFRMNVVEAASFYLGGVSSESAVTHQAAYGNYLMLSCLNVPNEQKLEITATPALKTAPIVFRRGEKVYAAIPADTVGARTLKIKYGTIESTFYLNVTASAATEHTLDADALRGDWEMALDGGKLAELIAAKGANTDSTVGHLLTPTGTFAAPDSSSPVISFADRLTVTGNAAISDREIPFELYHSSNTVLAGAAGRVAERGENDILGKYVIIDHGCGLYSWYCGLSEFDEVRTAVGRPVSKGDIVGRSGKTALGMKDTDGFLLLVTWGKQAIDPAYLRSTPFSIIQ